MPTDGTIIRGSYINKAHYRKYIWRICECGVGSWATLQVKKGIPLNKRCIKCQHKHMHPSGNKAHTWKGGRISIPQGYILIFLTPDSPFYPMTRQDWYVSEHRLIMAKHLNRCLHKWEVVHHINGIKDDNRLENLQLLPNNTIHAVDTELKIYMHKLERQISEIILEINKLRRKHETLRTSKRIRQITGQTRTS